MSLTEAFKMLHTKNESKYENNVKEVILNEEQKTYLSDILDRHSYHSYDYMELEESVRDSKADKKVQEELAKEWKVKIQDKLCEDGFPYTLFIDNKEITMLSESNMDEIHLLEGINKEKEIKDIKDRMQSILDELADRNDLVEISEKDLKELDEESVRYLNYEEDEVGEFDIYEFNHEDIGEYFDLKKKLEELTKDESMKDIEQKLDKKDIKVEKKETPEDLGLPKDVVIDLETMDKLDINPSETDGDEINEILSDYLSDTYGFCHFGFETDVENDHINIRNIKWDISESCKKQEHVGGTTTPKENEKKVKQVLNKRPDSKDKDMTAQEIDDAQIRGELTERKIKSPEDKKLTEAEVENIEDFEFVKIEARRDGYGPDQVVEDAMTVGELRELLENNYSDDLPIILSHDNGYTYGPLTKGCIRFGRYKDGEGDIEKSCNKDESLKGDQHLDLNDDLAARLRGFFKFWIKKGANYNELTSAFEFLLNHLEQEEEKQMKENEKEVKESKQSILVRDINVGDIVGEFDTEEEAVKFIEDDHGDHNYEVIDDNGDDIDIITDESKKVTESPVSDLEIRYDARKSFYNKARVDTGKDGKVNKLYSYNTLVAEIKDGKPIVYGTYSQTTLRHIKEFLKQNGFKADSKEQIEKDYMKK